MKLSLLVVLFGCLCVVAVTAGDAPKEKKPVANDKEKLQGIWEIVSVEERGKKQEEPKDGPKGVVYEIRGDIAGFSLGGVFVVPSKFKLDPTKKPKHIDFVGGGEGEITPGIYELGGDKLKICYDKLGGLRPKRFETSDDDNHILLILKRTPKQKR